MATLTDNLFLRKTKNASNQFEIVSIAYVITSDEIGTKESKRVDTIEFDGSIIECRAYIELLKEGYFKKLR